MATTSRREEERRKEKLERARQAAREEQEESKGGSRAFKLPSGVELYKPETGVKVIDFMCYLVRKGRGEQGGNKRSDKGYAYWERKYKIHRIPSGGRTEIVCCRRECFDEDCPGCEWLDENNGHEDEALVAQIRGQYRHLWIVNDKPGNAKNPLKIYDSNHKNKGMGFWEQVDDLTKRKEEYLLFADPEDGFKAVLTAREETFNKIKYNAITRIDFEPRNYKYPVDIVKSAPDLDSLLVDVGYEAMAKMLRPGRSIRKDVEEFEAKNGAVENEIAGEVDDFGDEGEEDHENVVLTAEDQGIKLATKVKYKDQECSVVSISDDGTTLGLQNDKGKVKKGVPVGDVELLPEEEDDFDNLIDDFDEDKTESPSNEEEGEEEEESEESEEKDDFIDDWDDEKEEEEEEEEAPKKKGRPKGKK